MFHYDRRECFDDDDDEEEEDENSYFSLFIVNCDYRELTVS